MCLIVNQNQGPIATAYTDLIRCSVEGNSNVLIALFDNNSPVPTNWFGWTNIPYQADSALGILKWYFNGNELGYQVETVEEEYRFHNTNVGVLFTIEWDFLGSGVYGQVPAYDFWTALGVIGGYVFLATQLYAFLVWSGVYIFRINDNNVQQNQQPRPDPREYGSL